MEAVVGRKQTSFRLRKDLLERMQIEARKENKSLNNFVENKLMDIMFFEPNAETLEAMEEVRSGKDLKTVDMSSFETFVKSCSE